jgi:hypothetical protein
LSVAAQSYEAMGRISSVTLPLMDGPIVLDYGRIYLIPHERMDRALEIITKLVNMNEEIMCISRMHPAQVIERWPLGKINAHWLSQRPGDGNISPDHPMVVKRTLESFMMQKHQAVAILDGLEYLSIFTDFHRLNVMFEELNDVVMERRSILLVPLDPRLFEPRSLARLRRFAELLL